MSYNHKYLFCDSGLFGHWWRRNNATFIEISNLNLSFPLAPGKTFLTSHHPWLIWCWLSSHPWKIWKINLNIRTFHSSNIFSKCILTMKYHFEILAPKDREKFAYVFLSITLLVIYLSRNDGFLCQKHRNSTWKYLKKKFLWRQHELLKPVMRHTVGELKDWTICSVWSKTTLITGGV